MADQRMYLKCPCGDTVFLVKLMPASKWCRWVKTPWSEIEGWLNEHHGNCSPRLSNQFTLEYEHEGEPF